MHTTKQPGGTTFQQTTLSFRTPIESWSVLPLINLLERIAGRHGLESLHEEVDSLSVTFEHRDTADLEALKQELEQYRIYCAWKTE